MSEKKYLDLKGLTDLSAYIKQRLKTVSVMPEATEGALVLYTGSDSYEYQRGHTYQAKQVDWLPVVWSGLTPNQAYMIWKDATGVNYRVDPGNARTLVPDSYTWGNSHSAAISGQIIPSCYWSVDDRFFYSSGLNAQFEYNPNTSTWKDIRSKWQGLTKFTAPTFKGDLIWTANGHVYASEGATHLEIDVDNYTITSKTWNIDFDGEFDPTCVWTDGTHTYYSHFGFDHMYELDYSTMEWVAKTWPELQAAEVDFNGYNVWNWKGHTYLSNGSDQYELVNGVWSPKNWKGLNNFDASDLWDDGARLFYSKNASQYEFNPSLTWDDISPKPTAIPLSDVGSLFIE